MSIDVSYLFTHNAFITCKQATNHCNNAAYLNTTLTYMYLSVFVDAMLSPASSHRGPLSQVYSLTESHHPRRCAAIDQRRSRLSIDTASQCTIATRQSTES